MTNSWTDAGEAAAATGDTGGEAAAPAAATNNAPLQRAQNPFPGDQPQTTTSTDLPKIQPLPLKDVPQISPANTQGTNPPNWIVMRPKRAGLMGVIDKMADVFTGTTRPEIYTDQQGNEYVYHPEMSRGQQWARIGGDILRGAGAGLAAGRGAGHMGNAIQAGFDVADKRHAQDVGEEQTMQSKVKQDMMDKANLTMRQLEIAEHSLINSRLGIKAAQEDADWAEKQIDFYTDKLGGKVLGSAANQNDIAGILKMNPSTMSDLIHDGTIKMLPMPSPDGHQGFVAVKMKDGWQNVLMPANTEFDVWDKVNNKATKQHSSGPMTVGEWSGHEDDFAKARDEYQRNQDIHEKSVAEKENLESEKKEREQMLPLKKEESKAKTAEAWANQRKTKLEAGLLSDEQNAGGTIDSLAQALVDQRTASSLLTKRKDYNEIMARADVLSLQQKGFKYNPEEGEIQYLSRKELIEDFADKQAANSIQSFDMFLGHAMAASQAVQDIRNTDKRWLNEPLNKIAKLTASQRGPALQAFMVRVDVLRKEFETTVKNNHALTVQDVEQGQKLLDDSLSPAAMQEVMRAMAETAAVRLRALDYKFNRVMHHHVPDLTSQDGQNALQHFGINPTSVYSSLTAEPGAAGVANTQGLTGPNGEKISQISEDKQWGYVEETKSWVPIKKAQ